ncbi:MGH1-like glycoside hydrolase domain-containing protein [Terrimonas pollutisoli]|uniref:MGH1-like glycoside hydrolase domain-containing protein n=1 Tax=Terrimonas pollutisoli TaxID=3034147 RepID=UPI0023EA9673|nr:glucosidase [Terrimonas sp. H1YJ31]
MNAEQVRLKNNHWKKWGPYLSERQWGTVREDYSEYGNAWDHFPHDHARSRVYRWGEDGIAGISDEMQRICFALTLWNGKDPILKERLFGLTGNEGNHGEDVKELYYYLDSTPTHSYMKHLYKYPQAAYPYADLVNTNRNRSRYEPEYELLDTGVFNEGKYFDVFTEYAKNNAEDIGIRITVHNRGSENAYIALLPTLWLRNLWSFGLMKKKPSIRLAELTNEHGAATITHEQNGLYHFYFEKTDHCLFTENETNTERLYGQRNPSPFVKDAFHDAVIHKNFDWLQERKEGTKFSPVYEFNIPGHSSASIHLRLTKEEIKESPFGKKFDELFQQRMEEADEFYAGITTAKDKDLINIQRQAFASMLWSKQYFNIDIPRWLNGDPGQPAPPESRKTGRNHHWHTLNNEDIISMPDKWEYPWYAAWDLAFHCVPLSMIDPQFAKDQLILFLREWYMHPNGQLPAYEWAFSDVNPPVHAWSCLQVYKMDKAKTGKPDIDFLERVFQKLLINFTWWVNRKDHKGNNVFEGGFLGLDNIGVFDRSNMIPGGGTLEQADGTSWMAMYCLNMLEMALEIAQHNPRYEDVTTKFFEHFVYIAESLNRIGENWTGAWDEDEGFFYDVLSLPNGRYIPLKVRSLVGLSTLFAVMVLKKDLLEKLPDFHRRLKWFQRYRRDNGQYLVIEELKNHDDILLSLVPRQRLEKLLKALLDEKEFLSKAGIRSISKLHETPYSIDIDGQQFGLNYQPAEGNSNLFGGNSNWRGPVWMPMNYLLVNAINHYAEYYKDELTVELPTGSGNQMPLQKIADEISKRLVSTFRQDETGHRPVNDHYAVYRDDPHFKDLVLFYEYFHGDTARGVGASHQTGWTGVVAELINRISKPHPHSLSQGEGGQAAVKQSSAVLTHQL